MKRMVLYKDIFLLSEFNNGLIIQFCYKYHTLTANTAVLSISYPIAFTSTPTVVGTTNRTNNEDLGTLCAIGVRGNTSCIYRCIYGPNNSQGSNGCCFIMFGF